MAQGEGDKMLGSKAISAIAIVVSLVVVLAAISFIFIFPYATPGGKVSLHGLVLETGENHNLSGSFSSSVHDGMMSQVFGSEYNTTISSGTNITLRIQLVNTGDTIINTSRGDSWPVIDGSPRLLSTGPCGSYFPYGYAVFGGNLTVDSIRNATPLQMYEPGIYGCPVFLGFKYYVFQPDSDTAVVSGPNPPFSITLYSNLSFSGYWTNNSSESRNLPFQNYHFNYFPQGVYTVVVADQWGALALMHFTVK